MTGAALPVGRAVAPHGERAAVEGIAAGHGTRGIVGAGLRGAVALVVALVVYGAGTTVRLAAGARQTVIIGAFTAAGAIPVTLAARPARFPAPTKRPAHLAAAAVFRVRAPVGEGRAAIAARAKTAQAIGGRTHPLRARSVGALALPRAASRIAAAALAVCEPTDPSETRRFADAIARVDGPVGECIHAGAPGAPLAIAVTPHAQPCRAVGICALALTTPAIGVFCAALRGIELARPAVARTNAVTLSRLIDARVEGGADVAGPVAAGAGRWHARPLGTRRIHAIAAGVYAIAGRGTTRWRDGHT